MNKQNRLRHVLSIKLRAKIDQLLSQAVELTQVACIYIHQVYPDKLHACHSGAHRI